MNGVVREVIARASRAGADGERYEINQHLFTDGAVNKSISIYFQSNCLEMDRKVGPKAMTSIHFSLHNFSVSATNATSSVNKYWLSQTSLHLHPLRRP